jgi:hypothetical protein
MIRSLVIPGGYLFSVAWLQVPSPALQMSSRTFRSDVTKTRFGLDVAIELRPQSKPQRLEQRVAGNDVDSRLSCPPALPCCGLPSYGRTSRSEAPLRRDFPIGGAVWSKMGGLAAKARNIRLSDRWRCSVEIECHLDCDEATRRYQTWRPKVANLVNFAESPFRHA